VIRFATMTLYLKQNLSEMNENQVHSCTQIAKKALGKYVTMGDTLMMEAASTSETSVNFYQTIQRNNSEGS
jgi:hypothetical protein